MILCQDPIELGWRPYVKTWVQRLPRDMPDTGRQYLQAMFDHSVDRGLQFLKANKNYQMVPAPEMSFVSCLCNILAAFIDFLAKNGGFGSPGMCEIHVETVKNKTLNLMKCDVLVSIVELNDTICLILL